MEHVETVRNALSLIWEIAQHTFWGVSEWVQQALGDLGDWIKANDQNIDEITVWCMAVGLVILAGIDARTWWSLRWQRDRTSVGGTLRTKKFWYAVILLSLGGLYSLTLAVYYGLVDVTFWHRIVLRAVVIVSMVGAVIAGLRFGRAMHRENWGRPEPRSDGFP